MANYCTNCVSVHAEPRSIAILVSAIKWRWLFETLIPYDEETLYDCLLEDYYWISNKDGHDYKDDWFKDRPYLQRRYNFRNKYWWSKRDVVDDVILHMEYDIKKWDLYVDYDSAWSPQLDWRQTLSEKLNLEVNIEFSEPWMWFSWRFKFKDWEEIDSEERDEDPYYGHGKECPTCWCMCDDYNPDDWLDEEHTKCIYCN